jgi:hypothetical protein
MYKKSRSIFFFVFSFILILASSTHAGTVFGPKTLTISNEQTHYSYNTFTVDKAGKGKLIITRITSENMIESGSVFFNSRKIPLNNILHDNKGTLTKNIKLLTDNSLTVSFNGDPGASLIVRIEQEGSTHPPVANLTADPASIEPGESTTLNWSTSYADSITIEPELGTVDAVGSSTVSPLKTTEYILTAIGVDGTATAQANVSVAPLKPTVTLAAEPETIAPGTSSTLSWNSEHADNCTIEPDIGAVATNGSRIVTITENTTYTISAIGAGGKASAQVLVKVYPVKVLEIDKTQADYKTPENTTAASTSALLQKDLDWYYQTFTVETAAQDKKMFQDAGLDLNEKFKLANITYEEYIIDKINYKDGILLISEIHNHDIDGTILNMWVGLVIEDGLWKITYKFSEDEELFKYNDVNYANCIASYSFQPADFLEDSCWHSNDLTNYNQTGMALDRRYEEELTTAVFNGVDNGLALEQLNDMPVEQLSMGGWIKADNIDHNARIIEIGQNRDDSTAIVIDPGKGLRYWVHVGGGRVERTAAIDYDFHDNQWHHVFLVYDGTVMKLYVDGQMQDSHPAEGSIDSAPVLNIGQQNAAVNNGTANTFKGRLDDIQIYNKALTADEILKKYENGTTQSL